MVGQHLRPTVPMKLMFTTLKINRNVNERVAIAIIAYGIYNGKAALGIWF